MFEPDLREKLRAAARQEQFLEVVGRDEATTRFHNHLKLGPVGTPSPPLWCVTPDLRVTACPHRRRAATETT